MVCSKSREDNQIQLLQERIKHLEATNSWLTRSLEALNAMGYMHGDAAENRDLAHIFELARESLNRIITLDTSAFLVVNEDDSNFSLESCYPDNNSSYIEKQIDHLIENGSFSWAINQNHTLLLPSHGKDRTILLHVLASRTRVRGMFLGLMPQGAEKPNEASRQFLSLILNNTAYALESAALYSLINRQKQTLEIALRKRTSELEFHSAHDTLTSLPNRFLFQERIQQAMVRARHHGYHVAVLLIDIDKFKQINEILGNAAGDRLLLRIARRLKNLHEILKRSLEKQDIDVTISRMGGDEFAVVVSDLNNTAHIAHISNTIRKQLTENISFDGQNIEVTTSIGISIYPDDASNCETLMKNAELAMYHAKNQGRNNFQLFNDKMNSISVQQLFLENQLRMAIRREEFILHYQPKIDSNSGTITGFEALIRWDHPERGLLLPGEFIEIAEEVGMINEIGQWVLLVACKQMKKWLDAGHENICVAVNLSARQFSQLELLSNIKEILLQTGLSPQHLELEITESVLMEDMDSAVRLLEQLHDLGIRISIDDFGTGYSSLYYLKKLPIDCLKIDRCFIRDIPDNSDDVALAKAIVAMSHNMGLSVIAEGVETEDQLTFLRTIGCDATQGYLISKPVPHTQATRLLETGLPTIQEIVA